MAAATEVSVRAFEVVLPLPNGIGESDLFINCCSKNDRKPSTPDNEAAIDAIWKDRTSSQPSLFNGTKFRFHCVQSPDASSSNPSPSECLESRELQQHSSVAATALLHLGITDYKSFLGTNCSHGWEDLDPSHLASPLGNAAIVETCDEKVVVLKRSGNVGECPHTMVMPGGHPEPEMIGIKSMNDWKGKCESNDNDDADWKKAIARELFDSMIREIAEETGIPRYELGDALCLGFTRRILNHRPDIIFYVPCRLSSDEVQRLYAAGPEHQSESTELILIHRNNFVARVLQEDTMNMPGCHRGGVELYRQYLTQRGLWK